MIGVQEKDKRLIVEDIDLTIKLASRKYGNRKGNHHMTLFAYQRIASSIENQSLKREIAFCKIDPAYTSQMGKFLFMRKYGISIHQAAAYTIGLVGLGLYEKLVPDSRMLKSSENKRRYCTRVFTKKPTRISGQGSQIHFQVFENISSTEAFRMRC